MPRKPDTPLRRGWTTGACAAAAARAAYQALLTGRFPERVAIRLPKGDAPSFAIERTEQGEGWAEAGIVKDAGDDPDVTHGALVLSRVACNPPGAGLTFHAGTGVGMVTRPGLKLAVGEPAINPGPRRYLEWALDDAAAECGGPSAHDLAVTISIPGGADLAQKTMNGRLGILGGLSVLGTTGIVVPYSCASWIHSIQRGIDVARAAGIEHLAAATGSTSEAAVKSLYGLPDHALLDMGDFVGGTLKYLKRHPVGKLTLAGGFAKMVKLAAGHLDLHSSRSRVETASLARLLGDLGAPEEAVADAMAAAGAGEVLSIARGLGTEFEAALVRRIAAAARDVALAQLAGRTAIEVAIFDKTGELAGRAGP
jgi:cobalt-precorrin-5B (C1)-methyltransferase